VESTAKINKIYLIQVTVTKFNVNVKVYYWIMLKL